MLLYSGVGMSKLKIITLVLLSAWSVTMWAQYFDKKSNQQTTITIEQDDGSDYSVSVPKAPVMITDNFWQWEARGRLNLIDQLLDDDQLSTARQDWSHNDHNILELARHVTNIQNEAYGLSGKLPEAKIEVIPMRGDANGLYKPNMATIYLNSRMRWEDLPFERFMEVVLHENMHHIMTRGIVAFDEDDLLRSDFEALIAAAFFHDTHGMAQDGREIAQVNPQELVAYRTQRAARYTGIMDAGLSAWDMSTRMQEIRVITRDAGL